MPHRRLALRDVGAQQALGIVGAAPGDGAQDARMLVAGGGHPGGLGEIEPPDNADALGDAAVHPGHLAVKLWVRGPYTDQCVVQDKRRSRRARSSERLETSSAQYSLRTWSTTVDVATPSARAISSCGCPAKSAAQTDACPTVTGMLRNTRCTDTSRGSKRLSVICISGTWPLGALSNVV